VTAGIGILNALLMAGNYSSSEIATNQQGKELTMSKSRNSYSPESQMEGGENLSSMDSREQQFSDSDVASRAYERWQRRGQPDGSAEEDWFEAERELESHQTAAPA
jgi:hypothetical protein